MQRSQAISNPFLACGLLSILAVGPLTAPLRADEKAAPPALTIESVEVTPSSPGADTLCRLEVKVKNAADQKASQLGFRVTLNGQPLPVYDNHLFMEVVEPGQVVEIPLYNFWSTETSRAYPASGKLEVAVTLNEARFYERKMDGDVEVWNPLGPVEGLPVTRTVTLKMAPQ